MRNSDRIIVLESGLIVEEGTPEELLAKRDGKFFRMYNDQKLDSLSVIPKAKAKASLAAHFSMAPADFMVSKHFFKENSFSIK